MVTSSVPTLRSLFIRRKPSTSTYEMQHDYPSSRAKGYGNSSNMKSQITSKGYSGPESSEENILPIQSQAVLKSTTYTVSYEVDPKSPAWDLGVLFYDILKMIWLNEDLSRRWTPLAMHCTLLSLDSTSNRGGLLKRENEWFARQFPWKALIGYVLQTKILGYDTWR